MRSKGIHEIPILRRKHLAGMITFETIARRTNIPISTKVEHLLVLAPIVTPQTGYPELAEQLLAAGLRAAPVLGKKGELVGVVSRTDLVRALPDLPSMSVQLVERIASPPGMLVRETDRCGSLFGHVRLLEEHPLPVIDRRGRLVGAVGVADLGRVLWRPNPVGKRDAPTRGTAFDVEVGTIMHSPAVTVPRGTTAGEAARLMSREKVSSVFVVEDGKPTGVVSQADLIGLAVGGAEPVGGVQMNDVYVQVHGMRGSGDPETLTEIDRVVARGLRHISRHVKPTMLSLHITAQGNHRSTDATIQARLNTDHGTYYASQTGWNFFAAIASLLDELAEQTRRSRDGARKRRRISSKNIPPDLAPLDDPELEAKIRRASAEDDS
jgi:CBS domain-containing protein